ncbi:hypothetical protein N8772_04600 [Rickettsiales bacterium]|nr:hypothetical protein [Rickettsiales bacterium]
MPTGSRSTRQERGERRARRAREEREEREAEIVLNVLRDVRNIGGPISLLLFIASVYVNMFETAERQSQIHNNTSDQSNTSNNNIFLNIIDGENLARTLLLMNTAIFMISSCFRLVTRSRNRGGEQEESIPLAQERSIPQNTVIDPDAQPVREEPRISLQMEF